MLPETSSRNTRLRGGTAAAAISRPLMPIWTSRACGFQGQAATSDWTANGCAPVGGVYA
jgi:hypothetical protein